MVRMDETCSISLEVINERLTMHKHVGSIGRSSLAMALCLSFRTPWWTKGKKDFPF